MTNPMRQIFNKLKWTNCKGHFWYIDRGTPTGESAASVDAIIEIGASGVVIATSEGEKYIPYHRIVEIKLETGETLLNRRSNRSN